MFTSRIGPFKYLSVVIVISSMTLKKKTHIFLWFCGYGMSMAALRHSCVDKTTMRSRTKVETTTMTNTIH